MKAEKQKALQKPMKPVQHNADIEAEFLDGSADIKELLRELVACRIKEKYEN